MSPLFLSLGAVVIISIISLLGVITLAIDTKKLNKLSFLIVSFATGALFGDAFIHLIPESFEMLDSTLSVSLLILFGIISFMFLEKFIHWRHCHVVHEDEHNHIHPTATLNLIGDAIHNFLDGILITASFMVNPTLGAATFVAVLIHEIPQEIGDFGLLIHTGMKVKKAILFNLLSASVALIGVFATYIIGAHVANIESILLPVTAGGFIYIAGSDLIPELKNKKSLKESFLQMVFVILGIFIMSLLTIIE